MGAPRQPKFRIIYPPPANNDDTAMAAAAAAAAAAATPTSSSSEAVRGSSNQTCDLRPHLRWAMIFSIVLLQLCWVITSSRSLAHRQSIPYPQEDLADLNAENRKIESSALRHNVPVFYNMFINPDNEDDIPRVRHLVEQQLSRLSPRLHHPVFVTSIGRPMNVSNTTRHLKQGSEMLTLHSLWDYCRNRTDQNVMYLHSKGSFHDRPENDLLRDFMTAGAVECSWHMNPNMQLFKSAAATTASSCNVCSSRFSPYPHPHTSGNMWTAKCAHVAKLINPLHFVDRMEAVPRAPGLKKRFEHYLVGRQRFAAEHWIYSHPEAQPCDLYNGNFSCGYDNLPAEIDPLNDFDLQMAPRFSYDFYRPLEELKPWTGLSHRLEEYKVLYNASPSKSWWGWTIDEWREEQGNKALDAAAAVVD